MRIGLMVVKLFYVVPYFLIKLIRYAKSGQHKEAYAFIRRMCIRANKAGRVKIEGIGMENIPKENGFILFPNHQGMFDVLAMLETCEAPFSIIYKKEIKDIILVKQIFDALKAIPLDREDLRQNLNVIHEMTFRVENGENFVIFAEGTRSKNGNRLNEMKAGSFKSAVKAKCPIIPVALIDSFRPFDEKSIRKLTVKVNYLKPLLYEEYKDMSTKEIAEEVKKRIEACIAENEAS